MNKLHKVYLSLFFVLFIAACDRESSEPIAITVGSQSFTVANNPTNNLSIGVVTAQSSDNGPLNFSIVSQSVDGALRINTEGGLTVENASAFDHDTNPFITSVIRVSSGPVTSDVDIFVNIDKLNSLDLSAIEYFKDVALGFEFGNESQITRKWTSNMKIFVDGNYNTDLENELTRIITELNSLFTDGFSIEIVSDVSDSNYLIFFGTGNDYAALYPQQTSLVNTNFGLFSIYWNSSNELVRGHMYVDTERANLLAQKHLLREELTQSLGLARDSEEYPLSIFQARWTTTLEYDEIDRILVRMLYSSEMTIGLNSINVGPKLRQILENDK